MTETNDVQVQGEMSTEEVDAAEGELRRAVVKGDLESLDRLLAEDVLFIGPDGKIVDKAQDMDIHRSGAMRIVRYEPVGKPRIERIARDVARLLNVVDVAVEMGGVRHEGRYLYTRIYVLRERRPQIVLAQAVAAPTEV